MNDDNQNNNQKQPKDPLEQAIQQIQESAVKGLQSELKNAAEEYAKAKTATSNAKDKVLDVIEKIKATKSDFASLKTELKNAN